MKLSESQAYQFIGVARKSKEVPQLQAAITEGILNVSTARRIVSVITQANQAIWIEKAKSLPQKKLEMEVVKENPDLCVQERIRPVTVERFEVKLGITAELEGKLTRIKDILSQKSGRTSSLEMAFEAMAECFLEKNDPIRRAERSLSLRRVPEEQTTQDQVSGRRPLPALVKHQVTLRDKNQCTYEGGLEGRCSQKRWIEIHHVKPVSEGGNNSTENLTTLCFHHHKKIHGELARVSTS